MKREVTMKKILVFTLFLCVLASSFATDYDIGGGQKLILKEDGTYEIITSVIDTSVVQGKQYSLDMKRSLDPLIELMVLEDPSLMLLGKDYVASLLEGMIGTENSGFQKRAAAGTPAAARVLFSVLNLQDTFCFLQPEKAYISKFSGCFIFPRGFAKCFKC